MRIRRTQVVTRVLGVSMGIGLFAMGVFALLGGPGPDTAAGDRALGLGVSFVIAGVAAVVGSLLVADPSRIW